MACRHFVNKAERCLSATARLYVRGLRVRSKQEVILTRPVGRLGEAGQIVKVAPGYARNKLIPELIALPAIDKYITLVRKQLEVFQPQQREVAPQAQVVVQEDDKLKDLSAVLKRLDSGLVVIKKDFGKKSTLEFCIKKDDVVAEVKRQLGVELHPTNLEMETDVTSLGEFELPLRFPHNIELPDGKVQLYLKLKVRRK
eukprot:TRINITY_DN13698_c0_g1_i1.p1 TRINITY_DN13698_c0_g1~~TRINITY_DN13698_c0_g1_i1.p1  ORF type:complete len:199 (-),score=49.18 TRINITY_DN13698_c0_g1_i1:182-778(-)